MRHSLQFRSVAITLFIALSVSYGLCILGDVLFGWTMYASWVPLLPGFTWPVTGAGLLIGLLWTIAYSVYIAILIVYPYNYLSRQSTA